MEDTYILRLRHDCEFERVIASRGTIVNVIENSGTSEYLVEAFSGTRLSAPKKGA